jgi:DNA-binding response OmpR family regulator
MKTLVYEPDPLRARAYAARLGAADGTVDVVSSANHAAQLMQSSQYERLALRRGHPGGECDWLTSMQQMVRPDLDVLDLGQMPGRAHPTPRRSDVVG